MKNILFIICLFALLPAFANQTPKPIVDAFQQKFANATNVTWDKLSETEFVASFDLQGKKMAANFNPQGQWLLTSTEVGLDGLPAIVRVVLQTRFLNWKISTAYKIEKADKTEYYRARVTKDETSKEVFVKTNGDIIKET
jgi:hypothetical protein